MLETFIVKLWRVININLTHSVIYCYGKIKSTCQAIIQQSWTYSGKVLSKYYNQINFHIVRGALFIILGFVRSLDKSNTCFKLVIHL